MHGPCSICSAPLRPATFSQHQTRYHASLPPHACANCAFSSRSLPDALAHSWLEGHSVKAKPRLRFSGPWERKESSKVPERSEQEEASSSDEANSDEESGWLAESREIGENAVALEETAVAEEMSQDETGEASGWLLEDVKAGKSATAESDSDSADDVNVTETVANSTGLSEIWRREAEAALPGQSITTGSSANHSFPVQTSGKLTPEASCDKEECKSNCPGSATDLTQDDPMSELKTHKSGKRSSPNKTGPVEEDNSAKAINGSGGENAGENSKRVNEPGRKRNGKATKQDNSVREISLTCAKCKTKMKTNSKYWTQSAVLHVKQCLSIRPYACSSCWRPYPQSGNVITHIRTKCPGGKVEIMEREKNEAAIKLGMGQCFPTLPYNGKFKEGYKIRTVAKLTKSQNAKEWEFWI